MIDTHCHLFEEYYENLDELICELKNNGIKCIINGTSLENNKEVLCISKKYDNIYPAIGFHPTEINILNDDYIEFLKNNINDVVAIGEIGLDYYWTKNNKKQQQEIFENQLKIAEKYKKPVIIHTRESINDVYNILKKYNVTGVIHAYSGSVEMARKFIELGFKIGIGGVVTFKNCNLKEVLKNINISDIVLETDSPYLSPVPERGRKNTPANLKYIAEFISTITNISVEEIYNITSLTARDLFDLN